MNQLELSRAIRTLDRLNLPELRKVQAVLENDLATRRFNALPQSETASARFDPDYPVEAWMSEMLDEV